MIEGKASRTALGTALHRAAHQFLDDPLIFADPLALRIIGRPMKEQLRAGFPRYTEPRAAWLRAFLVVRSRYAEDCLAEALGRGVRQYALLGAGLDTFAYRGGYDPAQLTIFEIDHPATQEWKRECLSEAGITVPASVHFTPVDFEREALGEALRRAGLNFAEPVFVAWLGVVPYLSREAMEETLRFVGKEISASSEIVFDYRLSAHPEDMSQRGEPQSLATRVALIGEPFRIAFRSDEIRTILEGLGFSIVEDMDAQRLSARYFRGRNNGFSLRGTAHIMRARHGAISAQ
jgi:methyltransferase (TIGR00027 family)